MFIERHYEPGEPVEITASLRAPPLCYLPKPPQTASQSHPVIETAAIAIGVAASLGMATILVAIA